VSEFANAVVRLATTNAPPLFGLQSLGVAAPSSELVINIVGGHAIKTIVSRPKAVKSLTCTKGPDFQSLCVAAVVEAPANTLPVGSAANFAFERKKFRLAFKLAGAIGVAPPAPPPVASIPQATDVGVPLKPVIPSPPNEVAGPNKPGTPGPPR